MSYQDLEKDEEGYLLFTGDWSRDIAEEIAKAEAIKMSERHWLVVNFVREQFEKNESVPEMRKALKHLALHLGKDKATGKYMHQLFPYGYGQQACKIAGMRKPKKLMLDV